MKSLIWVILASLMSLVGVSANMGEIIYGGMNGMMLFGWLFSLLVLIALILFIVWLIKQIQKK